MSTIVRPGVGQIWRIAVPAPWLVRPVGVRIRLTKVNEAAVGYEYLEDGGRGVSDLVAKAQQAWMASHPPAESIYFMIMVLGAKDYREGIMHHKFVVIDSRVVWTGSYNLTYQAAKNYETLLRIEDPEIAADFQNETILLVTEQRLWEEETKGAYSFAGDAFRCYGCRRILPMEELGLTDEDYRKVPLDNILFLCKACVAEATAAIESGR